MLTAMVLCRHASCTFLVVAMSVPVSGPSIVAKFRPCPVDVTRRQRLALPIITLHIRHEPIHAKFRAVVSLQDFEGGQLRLV